MGSCISTVVPTIIPFGGGYHTFMAKSLARGSTSLGQALRIHSLTPHPVYSVFSYVRKTGTSNFLALVVGCHDSPSSLLELHSK